MVNHTYFISEVVSYTFSVRYLTGHVQTIHISERQDYLLFANRRFLVQAGRGGDGIQAFRLGDSNNAIAVDYDIRSELSSNKKTLAS